MTTTEIRKAYADDVRKMADRIEAGVAAHTVLDMNEIGETIRVVLPDGYFTAPGNTNPTTTH